MLTFGIGPALPGRTDEDLGSLERRLGESLELSVRVLAHDSYDELLEAIGSGRVQLAWVSPVLFVEAYERFGVTLLVSAIRAGHASYRSVVFARADGATRTLTALRGARAAWVAPRSASGYLFARHALAQAGIDLEAAFGDESFLGSHAAVIEAVESGAADVGATYGSVDDAGTLIQAGFLMMGSSEMIVLAQSREIPADAICAQDGMDREIREALTRGLTELHTDPEGVGLLERLFHARSFEAAHPRRYEAVREALSPSLFPRAK